MVAVRELSPESLDRLPCLGELLRAIGDLSVEPIGSFVCGAGLSVRLTKLRLESGESLIEMLLDAGGGRPGVLKCALEPVGSAPVLGGFCG